MRDRDQKEKQPHRRWQYTCPICGRRMTASQKDATQLPAFFPFCSERCKLIDLGAWLDADYRIPGKPDEESERPAGQSPSAKEDETQEPRR